MTITAILIAVGVPLFAAPPLVRWLQAKRHAEAEAAVVKETPAIEFNADSAYPISIKPERWEEIGLSIAAVSQCPPPPPLTMDGVLYLDPDDFVLVRSRFQGEVVETPTDDSLKNTKDVSVSSSVRFGDKVKKGQLLCVIWSRELGEKRSELAQALSQLAFDRDTLQRLNNAGGAIPQGQIREAERRVHEGQITVERIQKTLKAWQLSDDEIDRIRVEVQQNQGTTGKTDNVDRWARVEIRSPIDGTVVEKDITVGMLVDVDDTLYKIANLNHLDVRAFAYEEDLITLQKLDRSFWKWDVQLKGDSASKPISGLIDRIGSLIDPLQHTGLVMGWVANENEELRAGQFVRVAVPMPLEQEMVSVPAMSVVDIDGQNYVLLEDEHEGAFTPVKVKVRRYQGDIACLDLSSVQESDQHQLQIGRHVVAQAAVEILSEYNNHKKATTQKHDAASEHSK